MRISLRRWAALSAAEYSMAGHAGGGSIVAQSFAKATPLALFGKVSDFDAHIIWLEEYELIYVIDKHPTKSATHY